MELTATQLQEVVNAVKADDISSEATEFLAQSNNQDYVVVIYDSVLDQFPSFDQNADSWIDDERFQDFIEAVKVHLQTRINY